jgi:hypothetical protein
MANLTHGEHVLVTKRQFTKSGRHPTVLRVGVVQDVIYHGTSTSYLVASRNAGEEWYETTTHNIEKLCKR